MKRLFFIPIYFFITINLFSQNTNVPAIFKEYSPGYFQNYILKGIEEFESKKDIPKKDKIFKADLSKLQLPNDVTLYKTQWHNPPISQGNTGSCWCFATTSFFETEIKRIHGKEIKLSEMWTVYWEYVEKARRFVRERGNSHFGEGSEGNAVNRIWKQYGVVPQQAYTGMLPGQIYHNHSKMFEEMNKYLQSVKQSEAWNEELVLQTIRSILNRYMGEPPTYVEVDGKKITPLEYLKNVIKINPDDYVDIMSLKQIPYYTKGEYPVEDNWWHCDQYYNVPLDEFMSALKNAIRRGYTVSIGGDVSEPGFDTQYQSAIVPYFDIPAEFINEDARQFRFSNKTTTDDHGMHLVGYLEKDGKDWYLLKDSGSGSRNCGKESKNFGYYFFHEDYVKLKMMDFMVHKEAVAELLKKFK